MIGNGAPAAASPARPLARLWEARKADPLLFWSFAVLSAAVVVPFWVSRFLPFLDLPQHLATIAVLRHLHDPAYGFAAYFTVEAGSTPYLLHYYACDVLSYVTGVEAANRVFLSIYAVLTPVSVLFFLSSFGRLRAAALLAFPLVFNAFLFYGFISFLFAFPFFFLGLGLVARSLAEERIRPAREGWLVLFGLVVLYSHPQIFLAYVGAVVLVAVLKASDRGRLARALWHLVPALALCAVWIVTSQGLAGGPTWRSTVSKRFQTMSGARWEPLIDTLRNVPDRLMSVYEIGDDEVLTLGWFLAVLVLLMLRRRQDAAGRPWREALADFAPEILTLCVMALYVALPTYYRWIWPVNWRLAPLAALLLLSWGHDSVGRRTRNVLAVAFAMLALGAIVLHVRGFREFDAEAANVLPVLENIEPRARVMTLMFDPTSGVVSVPAYLHFGQYHVVRNGGMASYSFAEAPQSPIRFLPESAGGPPPSSPNVEWTPERFRFDRNARFYDYFLVRDDPNRPRLSAAAAGLAPEEVELTTRSGPWALYRRRRAP